MSTPDSNLELLKELLNSNEDETLEFKEAKTSYDQEKLTKYCVALANERGGKIILGVSDKHPRKVVGSQAFLNLSKLKSDLGQRIRLRLNVEEVAHPDGRVVIVTVPSRPIGMPLEYRGSYWMRRGEELVAMSPEMLKSIFDESQPDYSAEICTSATIHDLDPAALERLRELWIETSKNKQLQSVSHAQLLEDAGLTINGQITYAALILLGTDKVLLHHLAQAETIFEYRSSEASVSYQQRKEFRQGFLLYLDELWDLIALRNDIYSYQEGLFRREVPTFNRSAVREALLNALAHRDYRLGGSIFVRQFPKRLEIVSPGGFPEGITIENLLWKQSPRNRRIAEVLAKCGLVERSGQGANRIFEACIQESKPWPDYSKSDNYEVSLILSGEIQDEQFLRFLERIGSETLESFTTEDFLLLDSIHRERKLTENLKPRLNRLVDLGIIERSGRGRGTKYYLSERFYHFTSRPGEYTRRRGLDKETNKTLLLTHIQRNHLQGSPLRDLLEVLPACSKSQVQNYLAELRSENKIHLIGQKRWARWYFGPHPAAED